MHNNKYVIGIGCIGSGVGQAIIDSLRLSRLPLRTVGLGTNPFAYGAYDCDTYDYVKSIYDKGFIDNLISKCLQHKIDFIIPGMEDEVLLCAKNAHKFKDAKIKAIVSDEALISICVDKEKMGKELSKICDVFVKNYNKETIEQDIKNREVSFPLIAKPRAGYASKGIEIVRSLEDLARITDDHIIQELAIPAEDDVNYQFYMNHIEKKQNPQVSEISIQLVYSPEGQLMGRMSSYNKLKNGVPIEIVPCNNEYIWSIVDQLIPTLLKLGMKGPLNIQGRLTRQGFKIFEINPRFTGITGLRALMGFNEVEACVKEWLGIDKGRNLLTLNYNRFGIRQVADKSISVERNKEVESLSVKLNGRNIKEKKTVLITGACGYLGQNLIAKLCKEKMFEVWAFDLDKEKIKMVHGDRTKNKFNKEDISSGIIQLGNVDILLHLGFTRPYGLSQQIADSLRFTNELFSRAALHHIPAIINISTQSVYGTEGTLSLTENTPVNPQTIYAQAKYATELFLESAKTNLKTLCYSSIRLGTLAGGANGLVEVDFLSKIARRALKGETIYIVSGTQRTERIDIRDAIEAIVAMLKVNHRIWRPVYNLGSGKTYSLKEIAEKTINISLRYNGARKSKLTIENKEADIQPAIDSSLFYKDMNWMPKFSIEESIESLFIYWRKSGFPQT
ncbi:MAG: NAD-dependent epimerase/dehydratase family protein [Candidatus Omnitrophica bacterium]|nr:NAD-dependent epimerase/dehydratase family protein [Candidatus Omnitrophota bacterium]MDD5429615.1 NAD-dependent epimerase/dehydratase family protein [Candidatus Omnitrophota bacterium]